MPLRRFSPDVMRRVRHAADVLLDDVSLRSNLNDAQAGQLMDWGLARAEEAATETADLNDEAANVSLEEKVALIRRVMRTVDRLMGPSESAPAMTPGELISQMFTSLQQLSGRPSSLAQVAYGEYLATSWPEREGEYRFRMLVALLGHGAGDAAEEE